MKIRRCAIKALRLVSLVAVISGGAAAQRTAGLSVESKYPVFLTESLRHGLDTTVSPCTDFDQFVNGGWRAVTTLPDSVESLNAFVAGYDYTQRIIGTLLDSARKIALQTTDAEMRVLGTYYESCMSADSIPKMFDRLSLSKTIPSDKRVDTTRRGRCTRLAMNGLSNALNQVFSRRVLTPDAESLSVQVVDSIKGEIRSRVAKLPYISADAKERALAGLSYMTFKIAKPSDTIDYSGLHLSRTDFLANQRAVDQFVWKTRLLNIDTVRRAAWAFNQYNPNAHFSPATNSIEVPAFLFQWPFFDVHTEAAMAYAAAGAVVGHEIIHAASYKLGQEEQALIYERAQILSRQYSALPPINGYPVNGARTLNENLADLGGLLAAYSVWDRTIRPSAAPLIDGFTPAQRFFLYYARMWRTKMTDTAMLVALGTFHSPGPVRVNGVVMNIPAFAEAFGCKEGDAMAKPEAERANIW